MSNPRINYQKFKKYFKISSKKRFRHILFQKYLMAEIFFYGKPNKIQKLTNVHIIERYNFGKEKLTLDLSFFENIIFTDECKFSNNPDSLMIYRKRGNYGSQFCSEFEKFPISCIAWGAIGNNFKPDLFFFF